MNPKRGRFLVVLVLFNLLCFGLQFKFSWAMDTNEQKATAIFVNILDDDDCNENHDLTKVLSHEASLSWGDCSWSWNLPSKSGCIALFREDDSGNGWACLGLCDPDSDDCAQEYASKGKIINAYTYSGLGFSHTDACPEQPIRVNWPKTYLCADDYYWHECQGKKSTEDEEGDLGSVAWANNQLYNCSLDEMGLPFWKEQPGIDADGDGFTTLMGDCADNPQEEGLTNPQQCPEKREDCKYPENSKCAVCINPAAPEVCGDGLNNDCGGADEESRNLEGKTSDNCHKNQYACEQKEERDMNNNIIRSKQYNVLGQPLSWINTAGGGSCCGYDGTRDLGEKESTSLCLNKEMVGSQEPMEESDFWGPVESKCDEWCWVKASNAPFRIFTLKEPDGFFYDVVSDSQQWHDCFSDANLGPLKTENPKISGEVLEIPNRFYCYKEGGHFSWAECAGTFDKRKNQNIKGRYAGDGLYSLYLAEADDQGIFGATAPKNKIVITPEEGNYPHFYGLQKEEKTYFDFSGYNQLEFFIKFINEKGEEVSAENLKLPVDLRLSIFGPSTETNSGLVFDRSVLGDVVNGPFFSPENWMHILVSIPNDLNRVSAVQFVSLPEKNKLKIRNVYLSQSGKETPLCSGKDTSSRSSWLTSFDDGDSTSGINAEEMCQSHYGPNAWLGDDEIVKESTASCCGNNPQEYYAGDSVNKYGCWNSQPIASGETTMNVEFQVGEKELVYSCSQEECLYPLPGEPPYVITNTHPELYDLYFLDEEHKDEGILLTEPQQKFNKFGNIKVRRIAQQVLFLNQEGNAEKGLAEEWGFYGCQTASDLEPHLINLPLCSVKGGKFCAASVAFTPKKGEAYTTINSWSSESIKKAEYQPAVDLDSSPVIEIKEEEITAEKRNYSTGILPGKNILPNAEFTEKKKENLAFWNLYKNGVPIGFSKEALKAQKITLGEKEVLRSERISVPVGIKLHFRQNGTAKAIITLVNKDGQAEVVVDNKEFSTDTSSFLILEFSGGTVYQPFLQVVDELGAADYNYETAFPSRSGLACCPANSCWNGYACVEEMGVASNVFEKIPKNRFYRCVQGEWKHLPVKFDWNKEKWGFCQKEEQCFVLRDTEGGSSSNTAASFTAGKIPTCINDQEYILDHYCEKGNWTSRTKFLALTLLNTVQENDYVLYCTDYRQALLDYENQEKYLGGDKIVEFKEKVGLGAALSGETSVEKIPFCFQNLPEGLVKVKENTCINNVCLLKEKGKVSWATSLNKNTTDADSFLKSLNVNPTDLKEACPGAQEFNKCVLPGPQGKEELWYSSELNALVYSKEGMEIKSLMAMKAEQISLWEKIKNFFKDFVGVKTISLEKEQKFITSAQDLKKIYLLSKGEKEVRALQEKISANKEVLVVEYQGFTTPLCDYVKNKAQPEPAELLEVAAQGENYVCTQEEAVQKFFTQEKVDFWWPQLTGELRVG